MLKLHSLNYMIISQAIKQDIHISLLKFPYRFESIVRNILFQLLDTPRQTISPTCQIYPPGSS